MPYADEAELVAVGNRFRACTLPKAEWTHAAHFAAAIWLIARCPEVDADADMPGMIRRYNESVGGVNSDTEGYHETITLASLRMTRAHLATECGDAPLHAIHARLMAGPLGQRDWMLAYWSRERLFSPDARRHWVEPDIKSLPQ